MKRFPIALKLLLLAGFPVLGVLVLASLVVGSARDQLRRGEALGSVESLAELSEDVSTLVYRLQSERARLALDLASKNLAPSDDAARASEPAPSLTQATTSFQATDAALGRLRRFVSTRDLSRLPTRLSEGLTSTMKHLERLNEVRGEAEHGTTSLNDLIGYYAEPSRRLIHASAALSELTDDGEVLRSIAALVAVLELEERASAEHALLGYVYATGDFPPGSFRDLMTLVTEEQTFVEVLKTNASTTQFSEYQARMKDPRAVAADGLRRAVVESIDGDLEQRLAPDWFSAQGAKVESLRALEERLNRDVRRRAESKLQDTRRAVLTSSGLVAAALLGSVLLAVVIGRGVTRSVHVLRDAANRVAQGSTNVRVDLQTKDELAALGHAFNDMTSEITRAREALREQTRMSRDLEIAASIQSALLPPLLAHPELEFAGRMQPAQEVGGDFYDVLCDDRSRALWITIGDVSGHGVPAGLVMLMTQSAFAAYFRANPLARPDEVIRGVNDLLNEQIGVRLRDDKYVTGLLLQHSGAGRFVYAGAHEWPLVWRKANAKCDVLEAPGPWLGIKRDLEDIPVSSLSLARGDLLCLYSDGLIEARDASGELFDMDRLAAALERAALRHESLQTIADDVLQAVADHAHEREDDWTLLLIRRAA